MLVPNIQRGLRAISSGDAGPAPISVAVAATIGYLGAYLMFSGWIIGESVWARDIVSIGVLHACFSGPALAAIGLLLPNLLRGEGLNFMSSYRVTGGLLLAAALGFAIYVPFQFCILIAAAV